MLPTVHYNMGGIPTNLRGQARASPIPAKISFSSAAMVEPEQ